MDAVNAACLIRGTASPACFTPTRPHHCITASTLGTAIHSSGAPAGLANGAVISFTGASRSGSTVSGSYQIGNIATDTVQGLLYAIEDAFDYEVDASIDASGRLIVTDTESGASSISLEVTGLDYGTRLSSNTGGTEGRNALGITASTDEPPGPDEESYGSAPTFDIAETGHLLWTADLTVNNGADISGTINGGAAAGSGQNLTYNGITVKYTGSDSNQNVGTVNLSIGFSDLLDRFLFNITDPIDGYLAFKVKSLQQNITNYTNQIEDMEAFIERKAANLTARFVRMETAISILQNQSNWLAGQLQACD